MGKLTLSFGTPEHGWLTVNLRCGDVERTLDVSDVPGDSLAMLADGVLQLVKGDASEVTIPWFLEPAEEIWTLRRLGDAFLLDAQIVPGERKPILIAQGSREEICVPIWSALRQLQVDPAWSSADHTWSHPFPASQVDALGAALGR